MLALRARYGPPPTLPGRNPRPQGSNKAIFLIAIAKIEKFVFVRRGAKPPAWDVLMPAWGRGRILAVTDVFAEVSGTI